MGALLTAARATIEREAHALSVLAGALDGPLGTATAQALVALRAATGRVIVSGMGKSGHIARKIAATFASTGRPALFVHPAEASHGDLGMVTAEDCVLAISRSGETPELSDLLQHCLRLRIPLIAMTFKPDSTLARAATIALLLPDLPEASNAAPAPTTSTTMCLAMGDALAVALLEQAGFTAEQFGHFHPGGKLGALLKRVKDVMRTGAAMPLIQPDTPVPAALAAITAGRIGCVGVEAGGRLVGLITDGDVRRKLTPEAFAGPARALMTERPRTISPDAPLADALAMLHALKINVIFAVDSESRPLGFVHLHDLLGAGVR